MNLLYISNEYPPETGYGGIGTYTKHCAEGMAKRGHQVHVLCRSESGEPHTTIESGVIVHRISPGSYPLPPARIFFPLRQCSYRAIPNSLVRLAWARQAYTAFKKEFSGVVRIDIVEYPECGGEGFYFSNEPELVRIVRLHTPWEMVRKLDQIRHTPFDQFLLSHLERSAVRHASYVTSPTQALFDILKHRWKLPHAVIIPNPIPSSAFSMTTGNDWLFLGRIEYRKGVHFLIEAYTRLCLRCTPPLLRLVGNPYGRLPSGIEYGDHIAGLIANVPSNGAIEWIRGVTPSSVPAYLRQSSAAFFPSLWENLSYSCLEAMASGLAVVASNCGGFPEMITNGETGLLVAPQNVEALTEALLKLVYQPQLVKQLGSNARNRIRQIYDTSIVCSRLEAHYQNFLIRGVHGCA